MWPRSLLAPFTDNPDLTVGDHRAYISYATTGLRTTFETIDVSFGAPPLGADGGEEPEPVPPRRRPSSPPSGQSQLE